MRFLVVLNPEGAKGTAGKRLPHLESLLKKKNADYEVRWTERPDHATSIAREERDRFDSVVAFGGDGTINEIINGLAGSDTHLGVIPNGTANDFARSFGIPLSIEMAVTTLLNGRPKRIDLGTVNNRHFGNAVGVGFDACTSRESRKIRRLRGVLLYAWATLKTLSKYESIPMKIELDNQTIEGPTYLLCVGNGNSVGGGLQLTPGAIPDDGIFQVCHVSDISRRKVVANFLKLANGSIAQVDEVTLHESRRVRISSDQSLPIHMDGEIPEEEITELDIRIVPEALSVIGDWDGEGER
ncbi:MAG: diacylglycerol/lipid kinase family protein [Fidelibacterota bacterium]